MATYLVTGGAGFIGSNLVHELVKRGNKVIVVDSLHTGSRELISDTGAEFYHMRVEEFFKKGAWKGIDGIFHLGKPSSSPMYRENREKILESVNGTLAVLEMAKELNVKLVTASSSSLYNGLEPPHREDMIIKPTDFYTEARLVEERLAKVYQDLYGVRWSAMRFFSVYGPREEYKKNYANLISQFIWSYMKNEKPLIYGDGSQRRDFVFVDDVVNALILAMNRDVNGIFNVGTGKSYSLNDVISIIKGYMGTDLEPKYIENPVKNYVMVTLADTSKSRKVLGFEAKENIEGGIRKTLNYYLNNLKR
ncbi:MAG: NAD-dependent epimerase/dehydratase family protein [Thermoplasmata archaeon]